MRLLIQPPLIRAKERGGDANDVSRDTNTGCTHSHLCIGSQEVQSCDVQAELSGLCELPKTCSHWHELVPGNVCGQLQNFLTVGQKTRTRSFLQVERTWQIERVCLNICHITSCSTHGRSVAWNSRYRQVGPREAWCFPRCCSGEKTQLTRQANRDANRFHIIWILAGEQTVPRVYLLFWQLLKHRLRLFFCQWPHCVCSKISFFFVSACSCALPWETWKRGSTRKQSHSGAEVVWRNQRAHFLVYCIL